MQYEQINLGPDDIELLRELNEIYYESRKPIVLTDSDVREHKRLHEFEFIAVYDHPEVETIKRVGITEDGRAWLAHFEETHKEREEAAFNAVWNELADTYPEDFTPAEEYEEPDCPFDPAAEVFEVHDLGIEITNEGFLLQRELCIYAGGHEDTREWYLEYTCWDGEVPF